ncbi:hypothetical protein DEIPH_ctg011orf0058 [Deinococcus phoenicis]|uniref:Uncharacterized protein n=1 Tax=Deinococcus phoenicis TaxID=1476583 RepID=A0A016QSM2_9DEIO|nr:hypothetical protein [Deinococcus phoenicis]EYB69090.1 hypothetical protein DEIPH_ctg011orf0058 [Deinococcus phoenicis]
MTPHALPTPGHDHLTRLDRYRAACAALLAASGAYDAAYLAAQHRHALALSHIGGEVEAEVSTAEKVEVTA